MSLTWPPAVVEELRAWSEKCYPYEGCAVLIGRFEPEGRRRVARVVPLSNLLRDRTNATAGALEAAAATLGNRVNTQGQYEFVMDPLAFNREAIAAEKEGLDVVGILHTHPDHPAAPSATDAAQPMLALWSNVIVKVDRGRFVEARSWVRDEEGEPFREEPISVE